MGATLFSIFTAPGYPPCAASEFVFHEGETLFGANRKVGTLFSLSSGGSWKPHTVDLE